MHRAGHCSVHPPSPFFYVDPLTLTALCYMHKAGHCSVHPHIPFCHVDPLTLKALCYMHRAGHCSVHPPIPFCHVDPLTLKALVRTVRSKGRTQKHWNWGHHQSTASRRGTKLRQFSLCSSVWTMRTMTTDHAMELGTCSVGRDNKVKQRQLLFFFCSFF